MTLPPRHIAVAVDVSSPEAMALAEHLVDESCALSRPLAARLTLVHAAAPMPILPVPGDFAGARALASALEAMREEEDARMGLLCERAAGRGVPTEVVVVTEAAPIPELLCRVAEERAADLLALCSHGRRGVKRLLLGSVAERVAHLSRIPVLLVRAPGA